MRDFGEVPVDCAAAVIERPRFISFTAISSRGSWEIFLRTRLLAFLPAEVLRREVDLARVASLGRLRTLRFFAATLRVRLLRLAGARALDRDSETPSLRFLDGSDLVFGLRRFIVSHHFRNESGAHFSLMPDFSQRD